jgi:hypothetical protein
MYGLWWAVTKMKKNNFKTRTQMDDNEIDLTDVGLKAVDWIHLA